MSHYRTPRSQRPRTITRTPPIFLVFVKYLIPQSTPTTTEVREYIKTNHNMYSTSTLIYIWLIYKNKKCKLTV